ncbi:MAG: PAS domain-containing sensor histidine kinase, partial [Candidatus Omnitrophica bacterium]|nr:PAS domain-containing sensor histidine kinase [Candidatus Omnitrophota bacterium]
SSAWDEIKSKHLSQESKISHFETKMQDRKGNLIDVDLSLVTVKDEAGNICGSMGIAKDISYKKNMQNALLKKERRYRRLVDLLSQTVFTMNDKFKIAYINNAELKLFKYSRDEFERRGMHFQDMISYEDISKVKEKISDMLRGNKESDRIECEAISRDKTKFPIMIFINKVLEGDEIAFQGIVVDITQRRKLERIQQDWVGVVSHELRTPLVPIREGVSQVLDGVLGEINASQKEFLSIVLQEIDRLKRIVDNLLNLFKFEVEGTRLERKAVDVALTAKKIATSFFPKAQSKNIDIKIRIPKEKISIYADEDKLSQVFANLIGNAVKFTEKGAITVGIKKRLRYLECFVQDTGHGISENDLPRLFKRFQMLKTNAKFGEPGTGLGLAICKDIVEAHGGKIEAASQIGKGTKITFKLKMHNPFELFQENTADFLNSAITQGFKFSVSSVKVSFPKTLEPNIRNKRISMFADVLNQYLKSKNLVVENFLINKNTLYFLFPDEHGKEIYDTMKNIENVLKFSISDSTVFLGLKMKIMVLSIPEDVQDIKDVFKKLG